MEYVSKFATLCLCVTLYADYASPDDQISPAEAAQRVDELILNETGIGQFDTVDAATFLRRASLDLAGRPPTAGEVTRFGLNPAVDKRTTVVKSLLASDDYATNWSRYWRDAIFRRATNTRAPLVRGAFEEWMVENLSRNRSWDSVVSDLLTASGPVNDDGSTALIFVHEGQAEEIAAEASRLFMGIQLQCANCHDHPWDSWKREQFHEFVAFFPRVSLRRDPDSDRMTDYVINSVDRDRSRRAGVSQFLLTRLDKNRDKVISEAEAKGTPLARILSDRAKEFIDKNKDGKLSIQEIQTAQPPTNNRPGQGSTEHYMADLSDPSSRGTKIDPAFFVGKSFIKPGQSDFDRRHAAADLITSERNPWFARAIVNRLWSELTGAAFYAPIDDLGPDREPEHGAALEVLCEGFVANRHDLKWLFATITQTKFYQRSINTKAEGFVRFEPVRLRSDQFYNALCQTLNVTALPIPFTGGRNYGARGQDAGRLQFAATFGFDPSTPRSDLTGNIPEALFLMNSPQLNNIIRSDAPNSTIARISRTVLADEDVVRELYVSTVSREPTKAEVEICMNHIADATSRKEGFEDVLWSLLNSSEFQSKR